jgi:long-chain acyl-CoA synthetase
VSSIYAQKPWLRHYRVSHELAVPELTVLERFEAHALRMPQSPALRYFEESISFAELDERAEHFAALLAARGVGRGDRVALSLQNDPEFAIAQLGTWKRGGIVVPLNPMFKQKELEYHLRDAGARMWLALEELATPDARAAAACAGVEVIVTAPELADLLARQTPGRAVRSTPGPDDIAHLVYTSGTTGNPKGAMITHRNVAFNAEVYRVWMELGEQDSILAVAPLFHITGLVAHLAAAFWTGIPLILFHRFDAEQALRLAQRWRGTMTVAAITAYIALMNCREQHGFIAKCYSGGAPVAPGLVEQFEQRFGSYIHNIYGLTESTSPSHATPMGARAPVDPASGALSIGVPIPNCSAKIVSLDDPAVELPAGDAGELALKGPFVFTGYWNKLEETARAFHDGYFRTGDVAIMDNEGWFYLVDRKKDMIIASGFKIWPREVEDTLYQHPAVREAAVIGVPDPYRGETVKAFVALKEGFGKLEPEEMIAFCRDRIAAYKCPREIEFLDELPKTATGKFLRRALRTEPRP